MEPAPLYHPKPNGGAYQLRYSWTSVRSVGDNTRRDLEQYLARQVSKE